MNFLANPVFESRHPSDENTLYPQTAKFRSRRHRGSHSHITPTGPGSQPRLWGRWVPPKLSKVGSWEGHSPPRGGNEFSGHGGRGSAFTHTPLSYQILYIKISNEFRSKPIPRAGLVPYWWDVGKRKTRGPHTICPDT